MTCGQGELCGFIDYNIEYAMFIMTYIYINIAI